MMDFNWRAILSLKKPISFESIGLEPGEDSHGVMEVSKHIYTSSQACHTDKGLRYLHVRGFIWAERLANARKISTYAPYRVERSGMQPPELLKPYDCGWSYDEMYDRVSRETSNPLLIFNWDGDQRVVEFSTNLQDGFCQLEFFEHLNFDGKLIGVGKTELWYERGDLSAPYAVRYLFVGDVSDDS
jgi:hypothetical protein